MVDEEGEAGFDKPSQSSMVTQQSLRVTVLTTTEAWGYGKAVMGVATQAIDIQLLIRVPFTRVSDLWKIRGVQPGT